LNSSLPFLLSSFLLFPQQELLVSAFLVFWYPVSSMVLPLFTKEKWRRERKESHGIKSRYFSLSKTSPFTCCPLSFLSFLLLYVFSISHCLILLYRSNASRDVALSLQYYSINWMLAIGMRTVPSGRSLSVHPHDLRSSVNFMQEINLSDTDETKINVYSIKTGYKI
jgi:hypothetical protein